MRVVGAGLNRADLMQLAGFYPPPAGVPVDIPGLEFSGTIESIGAALHGDHGGSELHVGARVFGIVAGGAQAEFVAVDATQCAIVPHGLDLTAMGAVPEAFITAHDALVTRGALQRGEWVLIHAVGSGVGTAGLQIAKALGCRVVGTARTADKLERCGALGLDHGIVAPSMSDGTLDVSALAAAVRDATGGGADVTLDLVGGPYVEAEIAASAALGRIVFVGTLAGMHAQLDVLTVMQKRLALHGTVLRTRSRAEKAAATAAFVRDIVPQLASGTLVPIVEAIAPLAAASAAYERLAADTTFGKLVLTP